MAKAAQTRKAFGWHPETFVCARRGHVIPAADVARLGSEHSELGVDLEGGRRLCRCTRCDVWVEVETPSDPSREELPPLARMRVPRRGEALREAIILRLIAIDRGVHAVLFGAFAVLLLLVELNFGSLRSQAAKIVDSVTGDTGQGASQGFIVRELRGILDIRKTTVIVLLATATVYCVVEGIEAVGLWRERRWAEYLTALATAGFLPFEIKELLDRISVIRVAALVINVAILVWLVYRKRLFGVRGGPGAERRPSAVDLFSPRASATR
jgi:uncharacterized membrane protein (DUF2068 family)